LSMLHSQFVRGIHDFVGQSWVQSSVIISYHDGQGPRGWQNVEKRPTLAPLLPS
jgi:hypothetical protein